MKKKLYIGRKDNGWYNVGGGTKRWHPEFGFPSCILRLCPETFVKCLPHIPKGELYELHVRIGKRVKQ